MQVVILAAGKSSRFYPFSSLLHKSLINVLGRTLLEHTLIAIQKSGISEVLIVVGKDSLIKDIIGDGKQFGLDITYVLQPEPLGMGDALLRVKAYIKDAFFLLHAHHIDFADFHRVLEHKKKDSTDIVLLAQQENQVEKYGILKVEGDR